MELKSIVKNTSYLTIIYIVQLAMPFFALPYLLSIIGPDNYGLVVFVQVIISYFSLFINLGLDISAVKNVAENVGNKTKINEIVSSVLLIKTVLFLVSCLLLGCGFVLIDFVRENALLFVFAFCSTLFDLMFPVWFYQGIEKMQYITYIRVSSIVTYLILLFVFIKQPSDYIYVPLFQSIANVFAGAISLVCLLKIYKVRLFIPAIQTLKYYVLESIPFFISRVSVTVNSSFAKLFSGMFLSMQDVAVFDLAQRIAYMSFTPTQMLNQVLYPNNARTKDKRNAFRWFRIMVGLSALIALFVFLIAPWAVDLLSKGELTESVYVLRLLCFFVFAGGVSMYLGSPVLVAFGHPNRFNLSVIFSTGALLLMYLLLYSFNLFSLTTFALVLGTAEFIIMLYRLYYCYKFKIFPGNDPKQPI